MPCGSAIRSPWALEAAHEKGVLHRDLKPGNVRLTPDGRVKLLDFGLAKAMSNAVLDSQLSTQADADTATGAVLGTPAYMSPEQARGQDVDRRCDVWAFACVLYEMLSGKRAFSGASFSDTVAAILDREPDFEALPPETPPAVRRLLRRCLQKERDKRLRDIGDVRLELEHVQEASAANSADRTDDSIPGAHPRAAGWHRIRSSSVWFVAGAFMAGIGVWEIGRRPPSPERPLVRMAITLPPPQAIANNGPANNVAISPDGRHVAYVAAAAGRTQIYMRSVDRLEAQPIPGTEGGQSPFFSPDSQWLGFLDDNGGWLKRIPVGGGAPLPVCVVGFTRGVSWGPDGFIVFTRDGAHGLERVRAEGGTPEPLTPLDAQKHESSHRLPELLPGGEAVLFNVKTDETQSWDDASIEALSLRTHERSLVLTGGSNPRYTRGHLVYVRAGGLWAAPFDPGMARVTGPPVQVLEGVSSSHEAGHANFGVASDGTLVYVPGKARGTDRHLVRVDRTGRARPLTDTRRAYSTMSLSPDGRRLALTIESANDQVWVYELDRGTLTPQTLRWNNNTPIWTPDGRRLTFSSTPDGPANVYWQPADRSGAPEKLTAGADWQFPVAWSPDGKTLLFTDNAPPMAGLFALPMEGDRTPRLLLRGPFVGDAQLSPDGRWLAYRSVESGRQEVQVTAFPRGVGRWPVSTDGGSNPVWARSGRELFYRNGDRMMAVTVTSGQTFAASKPRFLFEAKSPPDPLLSYAVTADGEFLMIEAGESEAPATQIDVVLEWLREVGARAGAR
jgi:eukaryotic-like serine/threonine-protein kinase